MSDLGKAYVQIVPEAQGISGKLSRALAPEASAAGSMAGSKIATGIGGKLKSVGGSMIKAGAIATAISVPIIAGIKKSMAAYGVQAAAETKLVEIYRSRLGVGKDVAKQTMELASALQKQGVVGDEVALSGAQQLATFAKMPGTVNALLPAMENLLVQQKGVNGTAQDATQIANLMGKVLQGQTGALKRVGISFTEAEEKVLKYGTEQEKAAMLAKVITNNVGEMNAAMLNTPEGKIQQMKNAFGDLAEQIGATLAPVLAQVAQWMSENLIPKLEGLISYLQEHPVIAKIAVGLIGLLAIGGPLITLLGGIISGVGSLMTILPMLSGPVGIVVALIGGVIAAGVLLIKNWDKIKAAAKKLGDWLGAKWSAIKEKTASAWQAIKDAALWPFRKLRDGIKAIIDKIRGFFRFDWKLPKIPLPHFRIDPPGWKIRDLLHGDIPHLGLDWYAKGGIMTRPTLFGGGEAGAEGIIPLDPFWKKMDAIAKNTQGGDVTINVYAQPGMDAREIAKEVERVMVQNQKRRQAAYGTV